jgi:hydroxylaminobenzene mutase
VTLSIHHPGKLGNIRAFENGLLALNKLDVSRRLLRHGIIVFLLGLATGLVMVMAIQLFTNPRLALAGHMVGVTTGMFLMLLGLVVEKVLLSTRALAVTFWSAVYGAYGNWVATVFGALCGTHAMTSLASAGRAGLPWQEFTVTVLFTTSGIATIVACVTVLIGLGKRS